MKKISTLMLLAGAAYALTGCMITDYPCITDTENPNYASCATNTGAAMHSTGGWAHIIESSQTATDINQDETYSNFIAFVSQDSSGNQIIADVAETQVISGPQQVPPVDFRYHSDQYAQGGQKDLTVFAYAAQGEPPESGNWPMGTPSPDVPNPGVIGAAITGNCATPEADGGTGTPGGGGNNQGGQLHNGFPAFDYVLTTSCLVADADLSILMSYFNRTNEAGRNVGGRDGITTAERVAVLKNATPTANGMQFTLKPGDLNIVVSQGTMTKTLDMSHLNGRSLTFNLDKRGHVGNAWAKANGITGSDLMTTRNQLVAFNKSLPVTISITIYGQTKTFTTKIAQGFDAQLLAATLDAANGTGTSQTGSRRR